MSTTFRPYVPDQSLLLPPDVREWLPEGHLAHHVSDLVDGLDLTAFYALYEGDGRRNAPYEPRMMVKVLLYAYATGVFSSRRVARKLEEDVGFRVLAAGNFPQHRTLCEFRRRHLEDFQALFVEVVRLAQELGLARLGKLSIDGTKVRANASKRKAMSYDRMQEEEQRLESEIEALLRQADAVDEAEDARLGAEVRGDDLPAELRRREERLAAIREAKARLEAAARAADDARGRQPGQARACARESASMRCTCRRSTSGSRRSPRAATSSNSSSGMLLQRKNESRAASSRSLTGCMVPGLVSTGSRSTRNRNSGSTRMLSRARWIPASKPPARRPAAKKPSRVRRSVSVTPRRKARRATAPRISRAHGSSSVPGPGRHTNSRSRLGVSPDPVASNGPAMLT